MKKLKVIGLLVIMVIGFLNGWLAFNYAADHAEAKIRQLKGEEEAPVETITIEEIEKAEGEHYMQGTMRSVGEWTYDSLQRHYNKHKAEFPEYKDVQSEQEIQNKSGRTSAADSGYEARQRRHLLQSQLYYNGDFRYCLRYRESA